MTNACIRRWRNRFEDYVRFESDIVLCDSDGNELSFENGKPTWNPKLTVYDAGNFVNVNVIRHGCILEGEEKRVVKWIREFAAKYGIFHVGVDVEISHDEDGTCTVDASTSFVGNDIFPKPKPQGDYDSYWVIGDLDRYEFYGTKDGFGSGRCPMTVNDHSCAERYESFEDARDAMALDDDVFDWVDEQGDPESVRPLLVEVKTNIKAANK